MAVVSIIKKSQLEGAKRLDAEYYQPEYLETRELISAMPHVALGEACSKFRKGIFDIKADTYTDEGIPFIRISNLKNGLVDETNIAFISKETNEKERMTSLGEGDFVLSKTAYPAASLITVAQVNISQDIIGISFKKEWAQKLIPAFVVAFLNSRFGIAEMQQWFQGNIQMHLSLPDAKTILIPLLPIASQKEVANLFEKSQEETRNAQALYLQAENLPLEELGLKDFKADEDLYSIVNFSDIKSVGRMDADYFQQRYERLLGLLKKAKPLVEFAKRITRRVEIIPQREYNYIEISDVNAGSGEVTSNPVLGKELPANAKIKIEGGELLVSKVRPTRGAVSIIPSGWKKDFIASGAFSVFDAPPPIREYLQVVLRSLVGKLQMERPTTGTSYPTITDADVENVKIPILSDAKQQKIAGLVRESHAARKKAKELLEEAKRKVEELIESQ